MPAISFVPAPGALIIARKRCRCAYTYGRELDVREVMSGNTGPKELDEEKGRNLRTRTMIVG